MGHNIHAFFGFVITVNEQKGSVEDFMYDADIDGSTLLHLAANSGVLKVIPCQAMNPQTWSFSVKKAPHSLISN